MGKKPTRRRRHHHQTSDIPRPLRRSRKKQVEEESSSLFLAMLKHPRDRWLVTLTLVVLLIFFVSVIQTLRLYV